jgi:hypothetical protein
VHVQANALVYVQGGYVNKDQGTFQCTTQNYGTIWLLNGTSPFRRSLTNGLEGGHLRRDRLGDLEVWNFAVTLPKRRYL